MPRAVAVLAVELLTRLPWTPWTSRLVDRALVRLEAEP